MQEGSANSVQEVLEVNKSFLFIFGVTHSFVDSLKANFTILKCYTFTILKLYSFDNFYFQFRGWVSSPHEPFAPPGHCPPLAQMLHLPILS